MPYPIPHYEPIPFPAPVWLLTSLLVLGFYLHAIPMNVALVGGPIAAIFLTRKNPYSKRFGQALAFSLPFFVSVAITQGVVPLLFIQLLYGPLFYTSSIIMGAPWMLLLALLLVAYYAYYFFTYRRKDLGHFAPLVLVGAGLLFLVIAFFFTNNTTLMIEPWRWAEKYQASPSGWNLNLESPQIVPRYLHFVLAAIAVTGLTAGCFGLYWKHRDPDYSRWLIRTGSGIYLSITLLQVGVGIWFLLSLPQAIYMNFLGGDGLGTSVFMGAMTLDLISLGAMGLAWSKRSDGAFKVGLVAALGLILLMVITRHLVRVYYTQPFFTPDIAPVETQTVLLALFFISVVIGLAYVAWLLKITWETL
jgi:hypothetical protein